MGVFSCFSLNLFSLPMCCKQAAWIFLFSAQSWVPRSGCRLQDSAIIPQCGLFCSTPPYLPWLLTATDLSSVTLEDTFVHKERIADQGTHTVSSLFEADFFPPSMVPTTSTEVFTLANSLLLPSTILPMAVTHLQLPLLKGHMGSVYFLTDCS